MTAPVPTTDPMFPGHWLETAEGICARYYAEFPDHDERYGARGRDFCAHDNAYLVAWLVDALDLHSDALFTRNVAWLRGILDARGFPMDAFRRNLELVAETVIELRPDDAGAVERCLEAARSGDGEPPA